MKFLKISFIILSAIYSININSTIEYLDTTFGANANGIVFTNLFTSSQINAVAKYPNNKMVATGSTIINGVSNIFAARYNLNGSLDTTFNSSGIVTNLNGTSCASNAITVDSSNNIVIAGTCVISSANNILISRYLPSGSLDLTFGTGGVVTKLVGTSAIANAVTIDANNNILVAGTATVSGKSNLFVARYHNNGTIDTTFGSSGVKTLTASNGYTVNSIAIDQSSKIVVGGSAIIPTGSNFLVARLTTAGVTDSTFGTNGVATTAISGSTTSVIKSIFIDQSNRIVVGGYSGSATSSNFTVARYKSNGTLDTSFGSNLNGIEIINFGTNSQINSVISDLNNNIVASGFSAYQYATVRYTTNGSPDLTFGVNGILLTNFGYATTAQNNSLLVETFDGRVVTGGFGNLTGQNQSTLLRYNKNNTDFININSISSGNINTKVPTISGISSGVNGQVQVLINGSLFTTVNTDSSGNWDAGQTSILPIGTNTIQVNLLSSNNYIVGEAKNINVIDNLSEDSVFVYSTQSQTTTNSNYLSVPFNNLVRLGTWTYSNNQFTCNKTGVFQIEYTANAGLNGSVPGNTFAVDVATAVGINNTEYLGSEADASIDLANNFTRTLTRSFVKNLNSGDIITLKFAVNIVGNNTGFNAGLMTSTNAIGNQPTYSLTITRIG